VETRVPSLARVLPIVLLIIGSVVIGILTWRTFGGSVPLEPRGYRAILELPQASNLHAQADVQIAGVDVGRVREVARNGRSARVTVEIDERYAPLRTGTRARLRSKTLLGEAYLELEPGAVRAPDLPEDGVLPLANALPTQRLDNVLETFGPRTRARLRTMLGGMAEAFAARGPEVNDAIGRLDPVLGDFATVADELDRQGDSLGTLFARSGEVFDVLGRRQGAMQAAIRQGNRVFDVTARQHEALAATVRVLPPFLGSLQSSFDRLSLASADLDRAVTAVKPVVPEVGPALRTIESAAPTFRRAFSDLPPVIRAGNKGLPSLTRILKAAKPALREIYPTSRELIPVLQLLGTVRDSLILTLANVGQIHGGYAVGPGNVVTNYVPGVITLWNETIGGWIKRLPTHRGNAYPKPDFLKDIGSYKSFDCRHTKNTLAVPALGAAPPCITQGPWTFNGVTAYYPRVQPAPP
jgi:ABC-type transporter Mla subunit MlaD